MEQATLRKAYASRRLRDHYRAKKYWGPRNLEIEDLYDLKEGVVSFEGREN